jgi:hypothetical protein
VPVTQILVAATGVDLCAFKRDEAGNSIAEVPGSVINTGTMAYHPNVQGALPVARECWPHLCAGVTDAIWRIVGRQPLNLGRRPAHLPGVKVTGSALAIQPYLARTGVASTGVASTDVAIAPLFRRRHASEDPRGTRNGQGRGDDQPRS